MAEQEGRGRPSRVRVRVHWANVDPANKGLVISVCVNKASNRIRFHPGEEVKLTPAQLNVLRDSVDETTFQVPAYSGIYQSQHPLVAAQASYPNMKPEMDRATGIITVRQRTPNYIIEQLDPA